MAEARYDPATGELVISGLAISAKSVLSEMARWSTGERGETVDDPEQLAAGDYEQFVREALLVGSRVFTITAQSNETLAVQQAVKAATEQVTEAADRASKSADETSRRATEQVTRAAQDASASLLAEMQRLVGGENPELMERLRPLLSTIGTDLERQVAASLTQANEAVRAEHDKRHDELTALIRDVQQEVAVKIAEQSAAAEVRSATTLKGFTHEDQVNEVMAGIAAGLGDEYRDTSDTAGNLSRNKKGDGVLLVDGGTTSVVVEAHDGESKEWGAYLAEAERNRLAAASIGVVRRIEDNGGHLVRVIAPGRVVVAFNPETDDTDLLRTVVHLIRTVALTTSSRFGDAEVATANDHIGEALTGLSELDDAKKAASAIHSNADKVEKVVTRAMVAIRRDLEAALNALAGSPAATEPASLPLPRAEAG